MPTQSVLPPDVLAALKEADEATKTAPAEIQEPDSPYGQLAAGYLDDANVWHTDFMVRELTGRDEELMSKATKVGTLLVEVISRGLVSVGPYPGYTAVNGLLGGDWDTVLLAIRRVTFGNEVQYRIPCAECKNRFDVTVDLDKDIPVVRFEGPEDMRFTHEGRHKTRYEVAFPLGSTQRKILQSTELTNAEQTSLLLRECVTSINGRGALPEEILNMPLVDRRAIFVRMMKDRPGPRPEEVKALCPNCGTENSMPLSIAAMFQ